MMLFKKFALGLAPLALLASPACAADTVAAKPDIDPAVWVVKDADTTIYLFGTVHALDGKKDWFNDEVKTSFDKSDELVLELVLPENPAELAPVVAKYGFDMSGSPLSSKLSPDGQKNLAASLQELAPQLEKSQLPAAAFQVFKPFFAAITLTNLELDKIGMGPDNGAEKTLTAAAKASAKKISGLETMEFQMGLFDGLPQADQIEMLEKTLAERSEIAPKIGQMVDSWGKADTETVAKLMSEDEMESPALRKALLIDRNATWANWIQSRLDQPGTVFMAVGAGHLAGPDSVQSMLKAKGIASDRVPHQE